MGFDPIIPSVSSMRSIGTTRDRDQQNNEANNRQKFKRRGGSFMHLNRYLVLESSITSGLSQNWSFLLADCQHVQMWWVYLGGLVDKQYKYNSLSNTYKAHNIETFFSLNLDLHTNCR